MLVQGARNGLSVLRLAWQRQAAGRQYAKTASSSSQEDWLEPPDDHSSHHTRSRTSISTSNDMASNYFDSLPSGSSTEGGINFLEGRTAGYHFPFLESRSNEYHSVNKTLQPRSWRVRPAPLFPQSHDPPTDAEIRTNFPVSGHPASGSVACDRVADAVAAGSFTLARQICEKLDLARVRPVPRHIYFKAVENSLFDRTCDHEDFFFWLELIPFRPDPDYPMEKLAKAWYDLSKRVVLYHGDDVELVKGFIMLAADRNLLFHVFDPIFRYVVRTLVPAQSLQLCIAAFEAHRGSETVRKIARIELEQGEGGGEFARSNDLSFGGSGAPGQSSGNPINFKSDRRTRPDDVRALARRVGRAPYTCLNQYLRILIIYRHFDAAIMLFESCPSWQWTSYTTTMVSDVLKRSKSVSERALENGLGKAEDNVDRDGWRPLEPFVPLAERMRIAVSSGRQTGTPTELASMIAEIEAAQGDEQSTVLERFKHDFCMSDRHSKLEEGTINPIRERIWVQGMMIKQRDAGDYEGVVKTFASYYRWEMFSSHLPWGISPTRDTGDERPHQNVINTLISSLISLLPTPIRVTLPDLHRAFLRRYRDVSPGERLDDRTHAYWIQMFAHRLPPKYTFGALRDMHLAGFTAGELTWANVFTSLVRRDQWHSVDKLVVMAEKGQALKKLAMPLPTIGKWTYFRIWTTAKMCRRLDKADEYRLRGIKQVGVDVALADRRSFVAGAVYRRNTAGPVGAGTIGSPRPIMLYGKPRTRYDIALLPPRHTEPETSPGIEFTEAETDDARDPLFDLMGSGEVSTGWA